MDSAMNATSHVSAICLVHELETFHPWLPSVLVSQAVHNLMDTGSCKTERFHLPSLAMLQRALRHSGYMILHQLFGFVLCFV